MWFQFKYERLPSFCFFCGSIGHTKKFCEALFNNPQEKEARQYDSSLRAPMRKQGVSTENRWIRGVDGAFVTPMRTKEKKWEGEPNKTVDNAQNLGSN